MSSKKLFIHVGYPKCASTFLQTVLFSKHEEIEYIGKDNSSFFQNFIQTRESEYDPESVRSLISANNKVKIISSEGIVGHPFHAHYQGDILAGRLYRTFPEAKIIIFIRNQQSIIESLFLEWISNGATGKLGVNSIFKTTKLNAHQLGFSFHYFEYSKLISYYHNLFGKDNVKIFLYEDLKENVPLFIENFCNFLSVKTPADLNLKPLRERISILSYIFIRVVNRYLVSIMNPAGYLEEIPSMSIVRRVTKILDRVYGTLPVFGKKMSYLNGKNKKIISDFYKEDNRILSTMLNRDLRSLGYPV